MNKRKFLELGFCNKCELTNGIDTTCCNLSLCVDCWVEQENNSECDCCVKCPFCDEFIEHLRDVLVRKFKKT